MTHSNSTIQLFREVQDFQDALDFKTFLLLKSLKNDTLQLIHPHKINDMVHLPSLKRNGYFFGLEFDIFNQPLFVIARVTKDNTQSLKLFSKRFTLDEIVWV